MKTIKSILLTIFLMATQSIPTAASPLETLLGAAHGDTTRIPIIMYHVIEDSPDNIWEITQSELESDLKYLRDNGFTTIFMQDVIDYVFVGKPLPQKPIVLTFDDGRSCVITHLLPMLDKYDARATLAIIGKETDDYSAIAAKAPNARHPHLTWDQVRFALDTGRIEVQSHTYDLHGKRGAGRLRGETLDAYQARLMADLTKFNTVMQEQTGKSSNTLVFPLGIFSDCTNAIIAEGGFLASLTASEGITAVTVGKPESLFGMGRYNRPPHISTEDFFAKSLKSLTQQPK